MDLLLRRSIQINFDAILMNDPPLRSSDEETSENVLADDLIGNDDPNLEPEVNHDSFNEPTSSIDENISIQEYLNRFCRVTRDGIVIDNAVYTNHHKIDVTSTSLEDARDLNLNRT